VTSSACPDLSGPVALIHPKTGDVLVSDVPGFDRRCGSCKKRKVVFCLGDSPTDGSPVLLCADCVQLPEVDAALMKLAEREPELVSSLLKWASS
jgi:hypothetical protein